MASHPTGQSVASEAVIIPRMSAGVNLRVSVCGNVAQNFWHVPEHIKFVHVHLEKARVYSLVVQCVCQTAAGAAV